ncbi:MAG TPA: ABC transporter permease [Pseudonocardiaceae bacterium]|jgi:peptide/nickel transport system permease protein|nr:ABC transporter permease [Pseudonocardiaceae bacterium]
MSTRAEPDQKGADVSTTVPANVEPAVSPRKLPRVRRRAGKKRPRTRVAVGGSFLLLLILASLVAPLPYSPTVPDPTAVQQAPGGRHWFGTDQIGLDIFSRTLSAAHVDLLLALAGALAAMIVGSALGILASRRGVLSEGFMRVVDLFQAFPLLVVILTIVSLTGGGTLVLILTIAIVSVPGFIRLVRAEALSVRESRYIEYAEIIGASRWRVIMRHILPNVSGVVIAQLSLAAAAAVSVLAAMSYLGQGVEPPTASWGSMIESGSAGIGTGQWWPVVFPAAALALSIVALNLVADGIDAVLSRGVTNDR